MGRKLWRQMGLRAAAASEERWVSGVPAIVAENEDPERQHRIKVVIPMLDEEKVHDKWVRQIGVQVLGQGFGSFFVPPKGSEVVLFGQMGQKHNLYYMCVYNEDHLVPPDFENSAVCGVRAPGDMKMITEGDLQLRAGGMQFETDGAINIIARGGFFVDGKPV